MNSHNINANTLVFAAVLLLGLVLAVLIGDSVASGNYVYLGVFVLIAFVIPFTLRLGTNFWILIALSITADGRLSFVPLPFSLGQICTITAGLLFGVNVVMRRIHLKIPLHWPDVIVLLNVGWLVVTFVKNPTGLFFLGSDSVGAGKYVSIGFAFVGYFILSRCRIPSKWAYYLPVWLAIAYATPYALQTVTTISPQLGGIISRVYSVSLPSDAQMLVSQGELGSEVRVFGLERTALPLFLAMCAYYAPVSLINPLYPLRVLVFFLTFIFVGLSGFRSYLLAMFGYMTISTWLRGRLRDLIPLVTLIVIGVFALAGAVQSGAPVPLTIQRALSVLPLGWDQAAIDAAEGTTTWRMDMWRDAWNDPNYFRDKVFGDGFGFTQQELILFANEMIGKQGLIGVSNTYEMFIIRGSFHNGPLSSIRYGGFVGLILLTTLMIYTAIYSVKVVRASTGTVYAPIAFFTAIPLVYELFAFFAIIGAYDNNMIQCFLGVGMLNLISRSLPNPIKPASRSNFLPSPSPPNSNNRQPITLPITTNHVP